MTTKPLHGTPTPSKRSLARQIRCLHVVQPGPDVTQKTGDVGSGASVPKIRIPREIL